MHFAQSGCPIAHGKTPEECKSRRIALNRLRQKSLPLDMEDTPLKPVRKTPRTTQASSSVSTATSEAILEKMVCCTFVYTCTCTFTYVCLEVAKEQVCMSVSCTCTLHIHLLCLSPSQHPPPAPKPPAQTLPTAPPRVPPSGATPPSSIGPLQLARIHQLYDMMIPQGGGALGQEVDLEGHAPTTDLNLFKEARRATQEMLVNHRYTTEGHTQYMCIAH